MRAKKSDPLEGPSFDLGISQLDEKSISDNDSDHEKCSENRFKKMHDSRKVAHCEEDDFHEPEASSKTKSTKKSGTSRKKRMRNDLEDEGDEISEEDIPLKRKPQKKSKSQKSSTAVVPEVQELEPHTSELVVYHEEQVQDFQLRNPIRLRENARFNNQANPKIKSYLKGVLKGVAFSLFEQTIFSKYLEIPACNFQGHVHRCIREFQVVQPYDDQLWLVINEKLLKFTLREFALITRLKCTGNEEDFDFTGQSTSRLIQRYFKNRLPVNKARLLKVFETVKWKKNNADDAVKLAVLVFIHSFILSQTMDTAIPVKHFHLVENGSYAHYPRGKIAFNELMKSCHKDLDPEFKTHRLYGMPYALQVWIYECCNKVPEKIAVHVHDYIPRILNWRVVSQKLTYRQARVDMFNEGVFDNIRATVNEGDPLALPSDSADNVKVVSDSLCNPITTEHVDVLKPSPSEDTDDFDGFINPPAKILFHCPVSESAQSSKSVKKSSKKVVDQKEVTHLSVEKGKESELHIQTDVVKDANLDINPETLHNKLDDSSSPLFDSTPVLAVFDSTSVPPVFDSTPVPPVYDSTPGINKSMPIPMATFEVPLDPVVEHVVTEAVEEVVTGDKPIPQLYECGVGVDQQSKSEDNANLPTDISLSKSDLDSLKKHMDEQFLEIRFYVKKKMKSLKETFREISNEQDKKFEKFSSYVKKKLETKKKSKKRKSHQQSTIEDDSDNGDNGSDDNSKADNEKCSDATKDTDQAFNVQTDHVLPEDNPTDHNVEDTINKSPVAAEESVQLPEVDGVRDNDEDDKSTVENKRCSDSAIESVHFDPEVHGSPNKIDEALRDQHVDHSDSASKVQEESVLKDIDLENSLELVISNIVSGSSFFISDSQLPQDIPTATIRFSSDEASLNTPITRVQKLSKWNMSPYVTRFDSSSKDNQLIPPSLCLQHPFAVDHLSELDLENLHDSFQDWLAEGLLKNHAKKKGNEDHYKSKCAVIDPELNFVLAFPSNKNWFYQMSQPDICWNSEHIDVLFYYLRKKFKLQLDVNPRYTTCGCNFQPVIGEKFKMFKSFDAGVNVLKDMDCVCHTIMGFRIRGGLPWHMVDYVYIPVNCPDKFHWFLAVVDLKQRCIRIYDSMSRSGAFHRIAISQQISRVAQMLPYYLTLSGFLTKSERVNWNQLESYKGKTDRDPFELIYVDDLPQQKSGSLDCGVYLAAYAEFLSKGLSIPSYIDAAQLRIRYASLLWNYGMKKLSDGFNSDNDDPPGPKPTFNETDAKNVISILS